MRVCVRTRVFVCACVRACLRACVCVQPPDVGIGIYVFPAEPSGALLAPLRATAPFVRGADAALRLAGLPVPGSYFVVPCTFHPGELIQTCTAYVYIYTYIYI